MKKLILGTLLFVSTMSVMASDRFGNCEDSCKSTYGKRTYDKSTEAGACERGCSMAHWYSSKSDAKKGCDEKFDDSYRRGACRDGVIWY